jgi:hypothetical protein
MPANRKLMIQTHPCGDRAHPRSSHGGLSLYSGGALRVEREAHEYFSGALLTFHEVGFCGAEKGCGAGRARAGVLRLANGFRLLSPAPASPPLLHNPVFSL